MLSLELPEAALSLSAHPSEPTLAIGTTAKLLVAKVPVNDAPAITYTHPLDSVHSTAFFNDKILACSSDKVHVLHPEKSGSSKSYTIPGHETSQDQSHFSVTALAPYDSHIFLAGDSDGGVHMIDTRTATIASTLEQGDYITSFSRVNHLGTDAILSASGDGTLCAYDVRMQPSPRVKLMYATDSFQDDLLSLAVLDGCAVAGTLSGALNVYDLSFMDADKGEDGKLDRFFGHPECVNAVLPWEDCVITASSDGYVRVVDVAGRRLLGVLEYEMEKGEGKRRKGVQETWPVEGMVMVKGWEKPVFALRGHDEVVRFCDGSALVDDDDDAGKEDIGKKLGEEVEEDMGKKKKKRRKSGVTSSTFFDDL